MATIAKMFVALGLDSSGYDRGLKSAKTSLRSFASDLQKTSKVISGAAAIIGGLGIVALKQAAATEEVRGAFNRLAKDFGADANSMLQALDKAARGTVSDYDLMLTANKAMALGVGRNTEEMADLLEIARLKGKAFGRTTTEAFNDIAIGIGRQSKLILDNIGIIVDVEAANKTYAESLGKTVKQLNDVEKQQAFLNAVLTEGRAELAAAGDIGISTAEKFQQLQASAANITVEIGSALIPVATELFDLLQTNLVPAVRNLAKAFGDLSPEQIRAIAISIGLLAGLWPAITAVKAMAVALGVLFGLLTSPVAIAAGAALATFLSPALDPEMMAGLSIEQQMEANALAMETQDKRLKDLGLRYDETAEATQKMIDQAKAGVAAFMDSSRGANTAAGTIQDYGNSASGAGDKTQDTVLSIQEMARAFAESHPAVRILDMRIVGLQDQLDGVNASIKANAAAQRDMQKAIQQTQAHISGLNQKLSEAKQRLSDLASPRLTGMGALDDQIFNVEQSIKRLQFVAAGGILPPGMRLPTRSLEELQQLLERLRLQRGITFDPLLRQLQRAAQPPTAEIGFAAAIRQIAATKAEIGSLEGQLTSANATLAAQQTHVEALREAQYGLQESAAGLRDQITAAEKSQRLMTQALMEAFIWMGEDRKKYMELGGEAVKQAGVLDTKTTEMLDVFAAFSAEHSKTTIGDIWGVVEAWREAKRAIEAIAAGIPTPGGPPAVPVLGSRLHGGPIYQTGAYLLHRGEHVVPSGGGNITVNVFPQGHVLTDQALADMIREEVVRTSARNYISGIT